MTKIIQKVNAVKIEPPRKKRVAAYARISIEKGRTPHSLSAQISYYSKLIQGNADWEYAGVYADKAVSGITTDRPEFQRMLQDARDGKVDIILTKSISRFARNTVDLLETVRELKAIGIEVRFEKEKINSLSEDGELMLTLLASFAQEESRSISENVKWGIRKNFQKGIGNSFHIYGYRWTGKEFVIVEEEAEIVRLIYDNYLNGISAEKTEKQLEEMGVKSYTGGHFSNSSIRQILQQERYTGNTLFQKTYIDTFGSGKTKYNNGELPQYYARNTHPAIISEETFNKVQEIRQKKRELGAFANPHIKTTALTSKIKCKHCNRSFQRTGRKLVNGRSRYWICATRKAGQGNPCGTGDLHEEQLKKLINEVLGVDKFDDDLFLEKVDHIEVTGKDLLEFFMSDGSLVTRTYVSTARKDAWTPEVRKKVSRQRRSKDARRIKNAASPYTGFIRCGICGNSFYGQKLTLKDGTKVCYLRCRTKLSECPSNTIQESTLNALVCDVLGLEEYDEAAMDKAMDYCEIADNAVSFHFRDGHFEKRSYEEKKRGTPWTEERRQKALKGMKEYWSDPEHRKQASERMKQIRKEKKWSSK
jgi:DNA invertase Pin-like site-specific DNA recombinase